MRFKFIQEAPQNSYKLMDENGIDKASVLGTEEITQTVWTESVTERRQKRSFKHCISYEAIANRGITVAATKLTCSA